jgi:hypothetical protein
MHWITIKKCTYLYRHIITTVLVNIQFNFYQRWFDVVFLVSALSSIALLYFVHTSSSLSTPYPTLIAYSDDHQTTDSAQRRWGWTPESKRRDQTDAHSAFGLTPVKFSAKYQ